MLDQHGNFVKIKSYHNEIVTEVESIVSAPAKVADELTTEQSFRVECIRWDVVGAGELMAHYCPESDELRAALILLGQSLQMAVEAIKKYENNVKGNH